MPRSRFAVLVRFSSGLALAVSLAGAHAAELGETVVRSYIGQPLIADIELTQLADPSVAVVVRLAHPDVYKGANISMHPVLSSMNMSVMRRDGRQFLHITSVKPVDSEYVHLFVELIEAGKRNVRAETLWLTADPSPPPPPPKPAPAALPATPPVPAPVPLAAAPLPKTAAPLPRPALVIPSPPPAPRSCPSAEQVKACAETDYKNGLLSAQIVELEEKVKALELAMKGKADPAPAVAKAAPAKLAPPLPAKPRPKQDAGLPWLLIGGAVAALAAIGAAVFFILKRRKARAADPAAAAGPGLFARLAGRLRRRQSDAPQVEPELPKEG